MTYRKIYIFVLLAVIKSIELLVESNPCNWEDNRMESLSDDLQALVSVKHRQEVSRDGAARILGISTRTLGRRVKSGEIKPPHRNGDKSGVKFYMDELF